MLRIWLPLQEVVSQTGEFRNIDKRKTNVKTELIINDRTGGGLRKFSLTLKGVTKIFP
jgi:hypothetical protein